jgi:hypothetical protein
MSGPSCVSLTVEKDVTGLLVEEVDSEVDCEEEGSLRTFSSKSFLDWFASLNWRGDLGVGCVFILKELLF